MIAEQTQGIVDLSAGLAQIQALLDSLEFWLVPVASRDSHRLARTLIAKHYPDERGCRMAVAPTPDLFTMEIAGQAWRYRLIDGWPILAGRREDVVLDFAERVVLVSNRTDNATLAALIGDAVLRIIEGVITADNAPAVTRTAAVADWSWIDGEDEEDDDDDEDAGEEWKGGGK